MNRALSLIAIRFLVHLHNFSYKHIGKLSIIEQGGLHPKHHILNYHEFFSSHCDKEDAVLDIGCGNGYVAYQLAKHVASVVGIEIDSDKVAKAKAAFKRDNLTFITWRRNNSSF